MKRRKTSDQTSMHMCPICGERVNESTETFPFCTERCRKVDLGRWFGESYRISRPARDDDEFDQENLNEGSAN